MAEHEKIESLMTEEQPRVQPDPEFSKAARIKTHEEYLALYRESIDAPDAFWRRETEELVWRKRWSKILDYDMPFAQWFVGAELNVSESCLDRHLSSERASKPALLWEAEDGGSSTLSYAELHKKVVDLAAALRHAGIKKGDRVAIYMGMVPEVIVGMLACARIGAPHTVVFGGFAAESLRARINDCNAKAVLTQDGALRKGKIVPLKHTVDEALTDAPSVEKVFVFRRLGPEKVEIAIREGRDLDWYEAQEAADSGLGEAPEIVDSEHPLFILYTSGSTGKPKGVLHTSAGYLAGAYVSTKYIFDLRAEDIYWCTADVGWITGHSYLVYGPLAHGATCLIYEGAPNHPDWGRFWQIVEKHKVSILYTAPTAIRAFMRQDDSWVKKYDLSSLRLLGSVGEPINPGAWAWYYEQIGQKRCPIVDTWWQTETGSIMLTTLPGAHVMKPGSTGLPFFGVKTNIINNDGQPAAPHETGRLVIEQPWPSMLRSIWGDDERLKRQYFSEIPGVYLTGDGAYRDEKGYFTVIGRIDDVLNVAGHRIGTAEIESALVGHDAVAEAAAVGRPDEVTGQAVVVYVTLKPPARPGPEIEKDLMDRISREIGKFARPAAIRFTDALPKTRSGKIMRRLLKDIAAGREAQGDISTLEDKSVLAQLRGER